MKQIKDTTREKRIKDYISRWKWLKDKKYYPTNKVSVAAYDSWAARGQAGGCSICNCENYVYAIHNLRYTTIKNSKPREWYWQQIEGKFCNDCYAEIEKQCNFQFIKY